VAVRQPPALRVYWGDRWTFLFWLSCFAVLAGLLVLEVLRELFSWLLP
jgi:hypothetical protein